MVAPEIKVLVVDDSIVARTILTKIISSAPGMQVVASAGNGQEALALISRLDPDVICTDLHMPLMDGLALTRRVMAESPRPILVVSVSVQQSNIDNIFNLLAAGAVDIFPKPKGTAAADYEWNSAALISKIRVVAGVHTFQRPLKITKPAPQAIPRVVSPTAPPLRVGVIGASTGGPPVLAGLLAQLPAAFPLPLVCVQHIDAMFLPDLVAWLASQCRLKVKIADNGELMQPGFVYFPQAGSHLTLNLGGRFQAETNGKTEWPTNGHCPSITVTMQALATHFGPAVIGILLTGMGKDGADGLLAIARAGGVTIAQNQASCAVFGMPKEAIALGAAQHILPPDQIARVLTQQIAARQTAQ